MNFLDRRSELNVIFLEGCRGVFSPNAAPPQTRSWAVEMVLDHTAIRLMKKKKVCLRRWRRSRTILWHKAYVYTDGNCESCVAPRKAAINDVGGGGVVWRERNYGGLLHYIAQSSPSVSANASRNHAGYNQGTSFGDVHRGAAGSTEDGGCYPIRNTFARSVMMRLLVITCCMSPTLGRLA